MKFCIATIQYWQSHGFNTDEWRKSTDGTKALVHIDYAKTLIPDVESQADVAIYVHPSSELDEILNSEEWTVSEGI